MPRKDEGRTPPPSAVAEPPEPGSNVARFRTLLKEGWSPPVARLVGFRLTEIETDRAVIEMRAGPQHANPMGTLHGGILCDMADAAMGMAYASGIPASRSFTTIELKINFLRPIWSGPLRAEGTIVRRGRTVGLVQCRITDVEGQMVAYATSTCMTIGGADHDGLQRPQRPTPGAADPSGTTAAARSGGAAPR